MEKKKGDLAFYTHCPFLAFLLFLISAHVAIGSRQDHDGWLMIKLSFLSFSILSSSFLSFFLFRCGEESEIWGVVDENMRKKSDTKRKRKRTARERERGFQEMIIA